MHDNPSVKTDTGLTQVSQDSGGAVHSLPYYFLNN